MNVPQPPPQIQETGRLKALQVPAKHAAKIFVGVLLLVAAMAFFKSFTVPKAVVDKINPATQPVVNRPPQVAVNAEQEAQKRIQEQAAAQALQNRGTGLYGLQSMFGQGQQSGTAGGNIANTPTGYPYGYQPAGYANTPPRNEAADRKAALAKLQEQKEELAFKASKASSIVLSFEDKPVAKEAVHDNPATVSPAIIKPAAPIAPAESKRPMYTLYRGTIIDTALVNGLDAAYAGPLKTMVTANVYSRDHTALLIKAGSEFLGEASRISEHGQERVAIRFDRLLRQDGHSIEFEEMPGLSQDGKTGIKDDVDHHYPRTFIMTAAMGALAGLSLVNTQSGYGYGDGSDAFRQGFASATSRSAMRIMDYFLHLPWTVTVRPGWRVEIFLMKDIELPAQE